MGLGRTDMERLEELITPRGPLHQGDHLFRVGDPLRVIYAVRGGYFKTYVVDISGRERVLGFHLPGELVGLDAIWPEKHQCNAIALDTATVCELPYAQISQLAAQIAGLQQTMFRLISKDIVQTHALGGDLTAEERIAGFLLSLSSRLNDRGYSATHLVLAMPRRDIADFLRLAAETVSRVFSRFEQDGLIAVDRREVQILDLERLRELGRCFTGD